MLVVSETDPALWDVAVPAGYRVRQWTGAAPDDLVDSYAVARGAIHDAPFGDLDFRLPEWTAARVREAETELRELNVEERVVVTVHVETGAVAGFTALELVPHRPERGNQRATAVLAEHREHGLGRCVKAHMMRWLVADRPAFERVITATSASNVHMTLVNHQLGYTTVRNTVSVNRKVTPDG